METIIEQMKKISLSEDPLPLLIDMKSSLSAISNREVVAKFETGYPISHIQPLFDVLNSSNNEQITTCVDVLNHILTKINSDVALGHFMNQYLLCLKHPHEKVRILILSQLLNCCDNPDSNATIVNHPPLVLAIISSLGDSSMEVSKLSHKILVKLCGTSPNSTMQIFTPEAFEEMRRVMAMSDSLRFQIYDVVVQISLLNENSLHTMQSSGIINQLIEEIFSGDILTQLNSLELISTFAESMQGLHFLKMDGVVGKLSYLLTSAKNDQMIAVLLPGLLKFFGHLGAAYPNVLAEEEPLALREVMRISCDFSGETESFLQLIAFETLAHIGLSTEGKNTLKKFNVEMEQSLKDFTSHISSFPSEMKVRILEALSKLFYLPIDQQSDDLLKLLETWFEYLSTKSSMGMIYSVARQPFPDLLCASLNLILSLAVLPWGLQKMLEEPGFFEWLLDRNSCKDKQSKEIRYDIISAIHHNSTVTKRILDEEQQRNIESFYSQGPFFVESELSVAFEKV